MALLSRFVSIWRHDDVIQNVQRHDLRIEFHILKLALDDENHELFSCF